VSPQRRSESPDQSPFALAWGSHSSKEGGGHTSIGILPQRSWFGRSESPDQSRFALDLQERERERESGRVREGEVAWVPRSSKEGEEYRIGSVKVTEDRGRGGGGSHKVKK